MSFFRIFDTAGSAMSAQSVRLNTTASNLANADSVASTPEAAYRAKEPVFQAIQRGLGQGAESAGVRVVSIGESQQPIGSRFEPGNPLANEDGYVFTPNVNPVDELVNMISASRAYQNDVEVMNSAKQLMLKTLELGK
jgi:flagellar basal-body rod protein FlgC